MNEEKKADVGVIIGRFQTNALHEGHVHLINSVCDKHKRVLVFLGIAYSPSTKRNPLDFFSRKAMIESIFPNITVLALPDTRYDEDWSKNLDGRISEVIKNETVMLYGSRDSFIRYYHGTYPTEELESLSYYSATDIRNNITTSTLKSEDFRTGVIYGINHRYDTVYSTVDGAIVKDNTHLLLAKKPNELGWRFIGGFMDIKDLSAEQAIKREILEETHIEIDNVLYISSLRVDDWRYKNETDKIMTFFFYTTYKSGRPMPDDDISELRWFDIQKEILDNRGVDLFVEEHKALYHDFVHYYKRNIDYIKKATHKLDILLEEINEM